EDSLTLRCENTDRIGQVDLTMLVVWLYLRECGPEFIERKAVDAVIDLVDVALLFGELRFFGDGADLCFRLSHDAPVAARIVHYRTQYGRGGIGGAVRGDHGPQRFCSNERSVAGKNDCQLGVPQSASRNL